MFYGLLTWNLGLNLRLVGQLVHRFLCLWSIDGRIFSSSLIYMTRASALPALVPSALL